MLSGEITDDSFDEDDIRALVRLVAMTAREGGTSGALFRDMAGLLGADFRIRVTAVADGAGGMIPLGVECGSQGEDDSAFTPRSREGIRDRMLRWAADADAIAFPGSERVLARRFVKGRSVGITGFFRDPGSPAFGRRERELATLAFDEIAALSGLRRGEKPNVTAFHFSGRRQEVVGHLKSGLSSKEIASAMNISTNTVNDHLKIIFKQAGVGTREALLRRLGEGGIAG